MNCNCGAYPFPHRPLGGACDAEGLWEQVAREGWACATCGLCSRYSQQHPYGEGHAVERLRECRARSAAECPGVQAMLAEVAA